jgi:2-alkyl-3-oxoalkanoate reductase
MLTLRSNGEHNKEDSVRVFVAGASRAIGTRFVPQWIDRRPEMTGISRSPGNAQRARALGTQPIALDLLDRRVMREAVLETAPDLIVHQATAPAEVHSCKRFDRSFAQTNRLRTEAAVLVDRASTPAEPRIGRVRAHVLDVVVSSSPSARTIRASKPCNRVWAPETERSRSR